MLEGMLHNDNPLMVCERYSLFIPALIKVKHQITKHKKYLTIVINIKVI